MRLRPKTPALNQQIALISLLLLIAALASFRLNSALWTDEMVTLQHIGAAPQFGPISLQQSLARVAGDAWQAPLYFILVYLWGQVAGWSPLVLRLFSLYSGLLALAVLFNIVRRRFSAEIAFYAVFTTGISAFFINYLYDMRGYALVTLLVLLLLAAYDRSRRPTAGWRSDVALMLAVAAVFYTHYFAIIAVLALGLFHLIAGSRRQRWWQISADFVLGAVIFIPWSLVFVQGLRLSLSDVRRVFNLPPLAVVYNILYMFSNGAQALAALLGLAALKQRTGAAAFTWFWLLVSVGIAVVASRVFTSLNDVRYLIFLLPALGTLAGIGIAEIRRRGIPAYAILGIWLAACLWNMSSATEQNRILPIEYRPPFDALGKELHGRALAGDVVIYHLPQLAPDDLMHPELLKYYLSDLNLKHSALIPDTEATTDALYAQTVRAAVEGAPRIWLTYETARRDWHIGPVTEDLLPGENFALCGVVSAADDPVHVELWAQRALLPDDPPLSFAPDEGGSILIQPAQVVLTSEHRLFVSIQWITENSPANLYSLGVHVLDGNGRLVAQLDHGLDTGGFGCLAQTVDLGGVPPGQYVVRVGAYNWQTGARLTSEPGQDDWQVVTSFAIAP